MKVLVCGGRTYDRADRIEDVLNELHAERGFTQLIHGGAPGADTLADQWARRKGVPSTGFPADWTLHGSAAGPIRNQAMADELPALGVAFPGGRGTADMMRRLRLKGIEVIEITGEK